MRFQMERKYRPQLRLLLSVSVFAVILLCFYLGVQSLSADTDRRQRDSLEEALNRGITYCYAVEGAYPESLEYLTEHYGLTYDHDRFFVDYRVSGANLYTGYFWRKAHRWKSDQRKRWWRCHCPG